MKLRSLSALAAICLLSACSTPSFSVSPDIVAQPSAAPSGGLASLLTGQVVSKEEEQLRDIKTRQILLDFPIKVGVVFYNLQSKLEPADLETQFDTVKTSLKDSGLVRETIKIPNALISSSVTIDELRRLGARFQCDIIVLITGEHDFEKAKNQNLSFFDSFSDKAYYESEVELEAITLDVFTGTLLSPFNVAVEAGPVLLDRAAADYADQSYKAQKEAEAKAWSELKDEALTNLRQLKADVDKRKANLQASPAPSATPEPAPTPAPTATPAA